MLKAKAEDKQLVAEIYIYSVTGGFFPDQNITFISYKSQNFIAYGAGFLMGSYFPFSFTSALT